MTHYENVPLPYEEEEFRTGFTVLEREDGSLKIDTRLEGADKAASNNDVARIAREISVYFERQDIAERVASLLNTPTPTQADTLRERARKQGLLPDAR